MILAPIPEPISIIKIIDDINNMFMCRERGCLFSLKLGFIYINIYTSITTKIANNQSHSINFEKHYVNKKLTAAL
jgi:hypothetical protein